MKVKHTFRSIIKNRTFKLQNNTQHSKAYLHTFKVAHNTKMFYFFVPLVHALCSENRLLTQNTLHTQEAPRNE